MIAFQITFQSVAYRIACEIQRFDWFSHYYYDYYYYYYYIYLAHKSATNR